jgi:hypothetical protein
LRTDELKPLARYLLEKAVNSSPQAEADWASYLLFEGGFAADLIAVGRGDALSRRDEILRLLRALNWADRKALSSSLREEFAWG